MQSLHPVFWIASQPGKTETLESYHRYKDVSFAAITPMGYEALMVFK